MQRQERRGRKVDTEDRCRREREEWKEEGTSGDRTGHTVQRDR